MTKWFTKKIEDNKQFGDGVMEDKGQTSSGQINWIMKLFVESNSK